MSKMHARIGKLLENTYTPRLQGSTTADEAIEIMDEYEINVVGVECENDFIGLFSREDFEKEVLRRNLHPGEVTLYEVITFNPPYVSPDLSIRETYNAMLAYQWKYMPVLSGKTLMGIAVMSNLRKYIDDSHENMGDEQPNIMDFTHYQGYLPKHMAADKLA